MSAPLFLTPAEIWEIAFPQNGGTPDTYITNTLIETAQLRFLKPALGELYNTLGESQHNDFVSEYIKAPLALYVRSLALNSMSASVGSLGVLQGKTDYATPASFRQIHALRKEARRQADLLLDKAIEYIESHPEQFPQYKPQNNIRHKIQTRGGFVLKTKPQ